MRLLSWLTASLLFLPTPQEPADRVGALIAKLQSEGIETREAAVAELVRLGPDALPDLQRRLATCEGEVRARLEAVIRTLEEEKRLWKHLAPGPTVTLKAQDRPAAEVLEAISRQIGVPFEFSDLPIDTRFSIDADRLPLPQAIDELCRRHGGVMYAWGETRIFLKTSPYRKVPHFDKGPFRFIADRFHRSFAPGNRSEEDVLMFTGGVIGPKGRMPFDLAICVEAAEDDQGTQLISDQTSGWYWERDDAYRASRRQFREGTWWAPVAPAVDARKLTIFRGVVKLKFIHETRRALTLKAPLAEPMSAATNRWITLELLSWKQADRRVVLEWRVTRRPKDEGDEKEDDLEMRSRLARLVFRDAEGRTVDGTDLTPSDNAGRRGLEKEGFTVYEFPKGFEPVALDLEDVSEVAEIVIPFDLGEIPLQ